ncbi:MAG TPA: carbonic anhydrase [Acidimicrobiia bacterium]|nr:carbonic anhydrase [Acidimicrobiia bacterium]
MERYGSVLECMDGRSQRKVADYLNTVFGVRNLDTITTAGAIRHLAEDTDQTQTLLANLAISVDKHGSHQIAVVAHHDCAGNPVPDNTQKTQVSRAMARIREVHPNAEVIGLWLDANLIVERIAR